MARQYLSKHDGPLADDKPDTGAAAQQKVTRIPASAVQVEKPAGAASSVFDIVKPEPKPARRPYSPRDPSVPNLGDLVIIKDRPIPPPRARRQGCGQHLRPAVRAHGPRRQRGPHQAPAHELPKLGQAPGQEAHRAPPR